MPSQENIQFCESTDDLNQMFCYENDLKSQLHHSFRLKNDSVKQPPSVESNNKGFERTDNYNSNSGDRGNSDGQISTLELNFETVCVHIYIYIYIHIHMVCSV